MRSASAFVTLVTLEVLYMKLDLGPEPFTNCVLAAPLLLAWVVAGVVEVAAAVMLPPVSLQLPGNLLLSPRGAVCSVACDCCIHSIQFGQSSNHEPPVGGCKQTQG
jgi:hypothetical protein